jgi:hypothetical protein
MSARLNEALKQLIFGLERNDKKEAISGLVARWARENFEQFNVSASVHQFILDETPDPESLKAHIVRNAVIEQAIHVASSCGVSEELTPQTFYGRHGEPPPYLTPDNLLQHRKFRIELVCLLRTPRNTNVDPVTPHSWMEKLVK